MLISHCNYSSPEINPWLPVFIQYKIVLYKEILSSRKTRVPTNVAALDSSDAGSTCPKLERTSGSCHLLPQKLSELRSSSGLYGNNRPVGACCVAAVSLPGATH